VFSKPFWASSISLVFVWSFMDWQLPLLSGRSIDWWSPPPNSRPLFFLVSTFLICPCSFDCLYFFLSVLSVYTGVLCFFIFFLVWGCVLNGRSDFFSNFPLWQRLFFPPFFGKMPTLAPYGSRSLTVNRFVSFFLLFFTALRSD